MRKKAFILCLSNPFRNFPLTFCKYEDDVFECKNLDVFDYDLDFIAYNFEAMIGIFRDRHRTILPRIIDLRTAIKLTAGKSKSEYKQNSEPWQLNKIIGRYSTKAAMTWLSSFVEFRKLDFENLESDLPLIKDTMSALEKAWVVISEELKEKAEFDRFFSIECEIYNTFLNTQLKGVHVSQDKLQTNLSRLKTAYFQSIKRLELNHGFLSQEIRSNLTWRDIEAHSSLCKSAYEIDSDFWRFVEIYGEYDGFLADLATAHNSQIDFNALLRYSVDQYSKIYPHFDVLGTVTARILVETPGFQYLKKTSRDMVIPAPGHVLLYADFAQFEPGIVAHHSNDKELIDLYNKGDVYSELSIVIFGDISKRKVAKVLFLSFLYGMAKDSLAKLIEKISSKEISSNALQFFDKFTDLCKWKENVCTTAKTDGFAQTSMGNRRYIEKTDVLTPKEIRWIPNQIVQGTASLIFKKALLKIRNKSSDIYFLLPMHDAILVEVPAANEDNAKLIIQEAFVNAFESECPSIKARVVFENFSK